MTTNLARQGLSHPIVLIVNVTLHIPTFSEGSCATPVHEAIMHGLCMARISVPSSCIVDVAFAYSIFSTCCLCVHLLAHNFLGMSPLFSPEVVLSVLDIFLSD